MSTDSVQERPSSVDRATPPRGDALALRGTRDGAKHRRRGKPRQLGDALAHYRRIFKILHVLCYVDVEEAYRRQIKGMRKLQKGRHDLARHVFHGRKGELRESYQEGMEDQLGALGLVLNCITLWNTAYLDLARLRADGDPVRESLELRRHCAPLWQPTYDRSIA